MIKSIPVLTAEIKARFWDKVDIRGENKCWFWTSELDKDGYGRFCITTSKGRKRYLAHRVSLAIIGKRSNTLHVLHDPIKCNNPSCVNPKHLRFGTPVENGLDQRTAGRQKGSLQNQAKLTEIDIPIIRKLAETITYGDIAIWFNVSRMTISFIQQGRNWSHVVGVASDIEVTEILSTIRLTRKKCTYLTDADIPIIRKLLETLTQTAIGKLFNISKQAINQIIKLKHWKHVIGVATDAQVKAYLKKNNLTFPKTKVY